MTINEFMAEGQENQVNIISEKGILLAYRNEGVVMYDLYNIDDFFVEFSYNLAHNEAVTMRIFEDSKELKPYFPDDSEKELFSLSGFNSDAKVKIESTFNQRSSLENGQAVN